MEKNIYEKMALATDKISRVAKNLSVGSGKNSYKAVGEADVLSAVKPIENECGIYSYPIYREIEQATDYTSKTEYGDKVTKFIRIKTTYRFVNIENKEDYIDIISFGDGVDPQDKASGKAMTYCDKYALLKAYKIETGEDPDQNYSKDMFKNTKQEQKITQQQISKLEEFKTNFSELCKYYNKTKVGEITFLEAEQAIKAKEKEYLKNFEKVPVVEV